MKKEMMEALRLTREGRLAEAREVLGRALGGGTGPQPRPPRAQVVETPALPEAPENRPSQDRGPEGEPASPPPRADTPETPSQSTVPPRIPVEPPPIPPFVPPKLTSLPMGQRAAEMLAKLGAHGPGRRQIPLEQIAPASGRWLSGSYTGPVGTRGYKLYVPGRYQLQPQPLPLIVMLHGCTQDPDDFAAGTRMNFLAEAEGFLVVYPEQTATANNSRCWNWFQPAHQQRDRGEPALIAGISRQVMSEYQVAAGKVYVAGLSAGGAMAAILAVVYPDVFAAVGVHSGLAPGSAHDLPSALQVMQRGNARVGAPGPARPLPLILFQGDQDSTVHPGNAQALIAQWISSGAPPVTTRQGQAPGGRAYTCAVYGDSSGPVRVEHWTVHGAGHAWAGGNSQGTFTDPAGPDASRELVRFFQGTAVI